MKAFPRRDAIFSKLKEEMAQVEPGLRKLFPTRSTVCVASLQKIRENYPVLNAIWHKASDVAEQFEMKARMNGVVANMKEFNFLFDLMLAQKLLKHAAYENRPGLQIILQAVSKYTNITECRRPSTAKEAEETKIL